MATKKNKELFNHLATKQFNDLIIVANLPYLSKKIYSATLPNVKNYEPKSALLSGEKGLDHYEKLVGQIKSLLDQSPRHSFHCFFEISPEQKKLIQNLIKKQLPLAKIACHKDLANKWRIISFSV